MLVAVWVKVWIKFPGVSFGRSAPWPLLGSSNQFNVIVEPIAFCHVPEPAVWKEATGPVKSVSLTAKVTVLVVFVVLIIESEEVLRMSGPGLAGVPVDVCIEPLIKTPFNTLLAT